MSKTILAFRCKHTTARHHARGLCSPCYVIHKHAGTLDQFPVLDPTVNRPLKIATPVYDEYIFLRQDCRLPLEDIAVKLGIKYLSLRNNMTRWRRNGLSV